MGIQPRRAEALTAALAEKEPETFRDWQKRLDVRADEYDARLQRRVLSDYVEHVCGLLRRAGEAGCDLVLLPESLLPVGGLYPAGRDRWARGREEPAADAERVEHDLVLGFGACEARTTTAVEVAPAEE